MNILWEWNSFICRPLTVVPSNASLDVEIFLMHVPIKLRWGSLCRSLYRVVSLGCSLPGVLPFDITVICHLGNMTQLSSATAEISGFSFSAQRLGKITPSSKLRKWQDQTCCHYSMNENQGVIISFGLDFLQYFQIGLLIQSLILCHDQKKAAVINT